MQTIRNVQKFQTVEDFKRLSLVKVENSFALEMQPHIPVALEQQDDSFQVAIKGAQVKVRPVRAFRSFY